MRLGNSNFQRNSSGWPVQRDDQHHNLPNQRDCPDANPQPGDLGRAFFAGF
jgi:hypothetical protein